MEQTKKSYTYDILAVVFLFTICCFISFIYTEEILLKHSDTHFLYNRAVQMLTCIKDGNIPWFYYNDFQGAGYGTSFFYGQLTLYPFLPLVDFGIESFMHAYFIVMIFVFYLGARFLCKRFTKDYSFLALIFTFSDCCIETILISGTFTCTLAIGIAFFFLGCCVDFFRDRKSFITASILYFVLLNTHTVTSLWAFIGCGSLMIWYFDKSRIKDYAKFALFTCLICLYTLTNMVYHHGVVTRLDDITLQKLGSKTAGDIFYVDNFPILGVVFASILSIFGYQIKGSLYVFNLFSFVAAAKRVIKMNKKKLVLVAVFTVGTIIGIPVIWAAICNFYVPKSQFPSRYILFLLLMMFILCFKDGVTKFEKWCFLINSCLLVFIFPFFVQITNIKEINKKEYSYQIGAGEYLSDDFVFEENSFFKIINSEGFTRDKQWTYYTVNNEDTVLFPKVWYKGYKAYKENGEELPVISGYSQFCEVDTRGYNGVVKLGYVHPMFLIVLCCFCYGLVVAVILLESGKYIKLRYTRWKLKS